MTTLQCVTCMTKSSCVSGSSLTMAFSTGEMTRLLFFKYLFLGMSVENGSFVCMSPVNDVVW